jgi:hypothetical protein
MFTLTPYDLSLKGVTFSPAQDSLEWDGITYVKGQAFPKSLEELAVKMCESYRRDGYRCFLLDSNMMLTVWRSPEVVPQTPAPPVEKVEKSVPTPPTPTADVPKPKRTYRGVVY